MFQSFNLKFTSPPTSLVSVSLLMLLLFGIHSLKTFVHHPLLSHLERSSNLSLRKGLSSLAHFLSWLLCGADLFLSLDSELQDIMTRARVNWLSQCEKPLLIRMYKPHGKTIKQVKTDAGMILSDQKLILYLKLKVSIKKLFKARRVDQTHSIDSLHLKSVTKLTNNQSAELDGKLTIDEISSSLKSMKNNKSPGIDRFPAEFCKVFWSKLKFVIFRALNSGYGNGEMSTSLKQCIISSIAKMPTSFMTFYISQKKNKFPGYLCSLILKRFLTLCRGISYMLF